MIIMPAIKVNMDAYRKLVDQAMELPDDFQSLAYTENCPYAAARHKEKNFYGVQFHPEVTHTPNGKQILKNFPFQNLRMFR